MKNDSLIPVQLQSSYLSQELYGWDTWDELTDFAYLRFRGVIDSVLDEYNLKWRIDEACQITRCQGLLVDLRAVELRDMIIDVKVLKRLTHKEHLRFAVSDESTQNSFVNAAEDEVLSDFEQLCEELANKAQEEKTRCLATFDFFDKREHIELPISQLHAKYYTFSCSRDQTVGYIKFDGSYRRGSNGKPDGMWVGWQIDHFCEYVRPNSLILDLLNLDYEWGDDLFVNPTEPVDGSVIVVIPKERQVVYSKILDDDDVRFDLDSAFAEFVG